MMRLLQKRGIFESGRVIYLPAEEILPNPNQPRRVFKEEDLEELSRSIGELGLLQPLSVRRGSGGWELIAGERRLRAAKLAGLKEVPCISVQADEEASSLLALVENLQRRDLDFLEEALALRKLIDRYDLSQEEAARRIGKSQSAVANKLRLLKLPQEALELLRDCGAGERHARALLPLSDPEAQRRCAEEVAQKHLTVAQTEALVAALSLPPPVKRKKPMLIVKDVRIFLNTISHSLEVMRSAGVDAQCARRDSEEEILLTIRIPRRSVP